MWSHLNAPNMSLADKQRIARTFHGQRVRWACTFCELFDSVSGSMTALYVSEPDGDQFFFDPTRADRKRLIRTPQKTRLVVEGTLSIDVSRGLLNLSVPVVRFDLDPGPRG